MIFRNLYLPVMSKSLLIALSICVYSFILFPACYVYSQGIDSAAFVSISDVNILYHEKSSSLLVDLYTLNHEFFGKINSGRSQFSILWETDIQLYRYKTSKNNLDFKIGTDQNIISFFGKFRQSDFFIEPGLSVSFSGFGTRFGLGSTLGWQPNETDNFQISFFNRKKSFYHEWNVEDSHAEFNQWSEIKDLKLSGGYAPIETISLKSEIRKQFYSVESESTPFSDSSNYSNLGYSVEFGYNPLKTLKSWIIFSDFSGNGEPDFRFQKFSFSSFNDSKTAERKFSTGFLFDTKKDWKIGSEFNYRNLTLTSSGLLQSFPFTAGVISILGDYYFFSLDGTVTTYELLFAGARQFSKERTLTIKIGYQLMEPDLFLQTWEPLFFTVGRKNEKTTQLDFTRLHIIPLTIQWQFVFRQFSVDLLLNQLIPVYAEKRINQGKSDEGTGNTSSGTENKQPNKFVWGGTELKLNISWIW